jgi:hypothetical protein
MPFLARAYQPLWPVDTYEVYRRFTSVAHAELAWPPRRIAARSVIRTVASGDVFRGYVVPGASHPTVTSRARPGRQLLAVQQVTARRAARDKTEADFAIHYLADLRPADGDTCRTYRSVIAVAQDRIGVTPQTPIRGVALKIQNRQPVTLSARIHRAAHPVVDPNTALANDA